MATRARILVVDDDSGVRNVLERALTLQGYDVVTAPSGNQAVTLSLSEVAAFDLLIADLIMPGATGSEVAERLREGHPDLRVLFMSGHADHPLVDRTMAEGDPFINKPFTLASFSRAVRDVLRVPDFSRQAAPEWSTRLAPSADQALPDRWTDCDGPRFPSARCH